MFAQRRLQAEATQKARLLRELGLACATGITPEAFGSSPTDNKDGGTDAPFRWEDGRIHALPQDYADMLGWERIAGLVQQAVEAGADPDGTVIFAENYGQAGAIEHYTGRLVISFSDSYRLWVPDSLPASFSTLVYVNDERGADLDSLFSDIRLIGTLDETEARELGTTVWLYRLPDPAIRAFYADRVASVQALFRRRPGKRRPPSGD